MDGVRIREELRPGDLGEVTRLHGLLYAAEYDLDSTFEAYVARAVAECVEAGWPGRGGEGLWVAENGGGHVLGHVALTREGPGEARLRWFLLTPEARGHGVGRRLLDALLQVADAAGHERITLTTFSELEAAAHLYRATGFERVSASPLSQWGRTITIEVYERRRPAGERSS